MRDLRERVNAGIMLITHDMGVVADMADRIIVMKNGRIVESGTADQIFNNPQHDYTKQLLAAVPHFGSAARCRHHRRASAARAANRTRCWSARTSCWSTRSGATSRSSAPSTASR